MLLFSFSVVAVAFDISWLYAGLEKFQYTVLINSVFKIVSAVLMFVLIKSTGDVTKYILIHAGSLCLGNASMWVFLPKNVKKVRPDFKRLGFHLKEMFVYFIPAVAVSIYTILDKTLIGVITGSNALNGYYESADKLINLAKTLSFFAIIGVMGSRVSYLFGKEDMEGARKTTFTTFDLTSLLSVGSAFGLAAVAKSFVVLFFGEDFSATATLIYILAPIIVIIGISGVVGGLYYTPIGKRRQSTKYLIVGSVVNLVLNIPMIIWLGAEGAAIASVAAELVITILYVKNCCGMVTWKNLIEIFWKKFVAGAIMFGAVFALNFLSMNGIFRLLVQVIGGAGLYVAVLLMLRDGSVKNFIGFIKHRKEKPTEGSGEDGEKSSQAKEQGESENES